MQQSELAARKAIGWAIKTRIPGYWHLTKESECVEDAASHALLCWFEVPEFARPPDLIGMQVFLVSQAMTHVKKTASTKRRHVRPDGDLEWEAVWSANTYRAVNEATQETHIRAIQALNVIKQMPGDLRAMAMKMADGCTLPEAATELGLDLYVSMTVQRAVRDIAHRIVNDGAVTGMLSDVGDVPPSKYNRNEQTDPVRPKPASVKSAVPKKPKSKNQTRRAEMIGNARRGQ